MFDADMMALECEFLEYIYEVPLRGFTNEHRAVRKRLIAQNAHAFRNAVFI